MLWKRNHSLYASSTHNNKLQHPSTNNLQQKLKNPLQPLLPKSTQQSIQPSPHAKFIVRKRSKSKNNKNLQPGTFFLHRGNNHNIIKNVLQGFGYQQNLNKDQCCMIWYQGKQVPKKDFMKKQYNAKATNYLPNHSEITNKQKLFENISQYDPTCVGKFIPKTFIVDFKDNLSNVQKNLSQFLVEYFKKAGITKTSKKLTSLCISNYYGQICIPFIKILKSANQQSRTQQPLKYKYSSKSSNNNNNKQCLWIVKPSFLNRGQGIEVISNLRQLQNILSQDSQQISIRMYQPQQKNIPTCYVIQQYIMDPLLYIGYKFDIRVWILLRNSKSNGLQVYIYKKGYTRLACHKYRQDQKQQQIVSTDPQQNDKKLPSNKSKDQVQQKQQQQIQQPAHKTPSPKINKLKSIDVNDKFIHLTNNAVQKNCKQYGNLYQGNQLLITQLVQKIGIPTLTQSYLYQNFIKITKILIQSAKQKLAGKGHYGSFQLMGLDFMIDSKLNVWLIQANCNPCLQQSSTILKQLIPVMLKQMFEIVKIHKIMGNTKQYQSQVQTINKQYIQNWEKII